MSKIIRAKQDSKTDSMVPFGALHRTHWILTEDEEEKYEDDEYIDLGEDDFYEDNNESITANGLITRSEQPEVEIGSDEYFGNTKENQGNKVVLDPR